MIAAVIIGVIAALSFYYVLEPIILKGVVKIPGERSREGIRAHYLEALRELQYDLESGKIDESEYEKLKEELREFLDQSPDTV